MLRLRMPVLLLLAPCLVPAVAQEVQATLNASVPVAAPSAPALKQEREPVQGVKDARPKDAPVRKDAAPRGAASGAPAVSKAMTVLPNQAQAPGAMDRVVFHRAPIKVLLQTGRERMLHFPNAVTLHVPADAGALLSPLDIIDRTVYATAQAPFSRLRVVAEDLVTGAMIPIDLQADNDAQVAADELEIVVPAPDRTARAAAGDDEEAEAAAVDMVTLTRYAARMVYAPRRLMPQLPGVRQVRVATRPVIGLYRGAPTIETTPIGAWRSTDLYVTAVKFVNRSPVPVELDLDDMRGQWLAATAQHGRLLPAGSDEDTTVVYLVSERPFEESR